MKCKRRPVDAFFVVFVGPVSAAPPGKTARGAARARPRKGRKHRMYRRKKRRLSTSFFWDIGTEEGTRTRKPVRALPPQGSVSTNSTTSVQNTYCGISLVGLAGAAG